MSSTLLKVVDTLFRSRTILLEMLQLRGYNTKDFDHFTQDDISTMMNQSKNQDDVNTGPLDILLEKSDKSKIYVKYKLEKFKQVNKLDKQVVEIFTDLLNKEKDTLVLLYIDRVEFKNSKENKVETYVNDKFISDKYFIQIFGLENFLFNPTKHVIVPQHRIMTANEIEEMMKSNNIKDVSKLPTIRREDPTAKFIGMKPGDVCEITILSPHSGSYKKYRLCTKI
jgi:DNA-directed RNA polymerase subunit H (RpoH/RPB5)